jgi:hypothetical protein
MRNPFESGIVRATWQDSRDTSTVWGRAIASSDPNFVAPGAIPRLLLQAVGARCNRPTDIGNMTFVSYTADYFFYKVAGDNVRGNNHEFKGPERPKYRSNARRLR